MSETPVFEDFIARNYLEMAALSWRGYLNQGRGFLFIQQLDENQVAIRYSQLDEKSSQEDAYLRSCVSSYRPRSSFVVAFEVSSHNWISRLVVKSPSPPACYYQLALQ
jgi:hypothetical protein